MRAYRLGALALVLCSPSAQAQSYAGIAVGSVSSRFHASRNTEYESQPGGSMGLLVGRTLSRFVSVQGEVAYAGRGISRSGRSEREIAVYRRTVDAPTPDQRLAPFPFCAGRRERWQRAVLQNLSPDPLADPLPGFTARRVDIGCSWVRERTWDVAHVVSAGLARRVGRIESFGEFRMTRSLRDLSRSDQNGDVMRYETYQFRLGVTRSW